MKKMLAGSLLALLLGAAFFLFSSCAENRRTPLQQSAPPSTANGKPVEPTVFPGGRPRLMYRPLPRRATNRIFWKPLPRLRRP